MRVLAFLTLIFFGIIFTDVALAQNRGIEAGKEAEKWAGVGILQVSGGGWCSAALLDQKTVLTAAHCVYPGDSKRLAEPKSVTFLAGWRDGITAAKRSAVSITAHRDYDPSRAYDDKNIAADVAIVELESPIELGAAKAYARMDRVRTGEPVSVVSFSGRRSDVASINDTCSAGSKNGNILILSCESYSGMSGAPIFSFVNGAPRIVALISGTRVSYTGKNNGIALALDEPLERVLIDAKATRSMSSEALPYWAGRSASSYSRVETATRKTVKVGGGLKGLTGSSTSGRKVSRPPTKSQ